MKFCLVFIFSGVCVLMLSADASWAEMGRRAAPLPAKPRLYNTSDLGVLERESQKFVAPVSAQKNPIPDLETKDAQGNLPEELTLEQSIALGIKNATLTQKAGLDEHYTSEALLQSYTEFLPNLNVGGQYTFDGGKTLTTVAGPTLVDSRNYGPEYTVTTSLNIFNGFADLSGLKASHDFKAAATSNLKRAEQEVALDITQAFLQVVLDEDMVEIAQKNLAASQAQLRLISASTTAGIRTKADLFQQQAETANNEVYFSNTQDKKRADLLLFMRKIRIDVQKNYHLTRPKFPVDAEADPKYADERNLISVAIKNRPDLDSSKNTASGNHNQVGVAEAPYLPRLDLNFGLVGLARHFDSVYVDGVNTVPVNQRSIATQLGDQVAWTAGLYLTWNLFDRGLTRLATAQARVNADKADIDLDDKEKQVVGEVRQSLGHYRASIQQLASSQAGLTSAQKAYDVVRGRYEVGASSFVDLITAQAQLVRAEGTRSQAVISYQLELQAMEVALGTLKI